jgi:hypothetical protein
MTPTAGGAAPQVLAENLEGEDTLYSSGGITVQGIEDDDSSVPSSVPSSAPSFPAPANMGRGTLVSTGESVWVATRIMVDGSEKTHEIGSVPDGAVCTAPSSYAVPVDTGGTAVVYVMSEFV